MDEEDAIEFAFAAWREEGRWSIASLPPRAAETLGGFIAALRQLAGEGGVLGFIGVEEEFFIAVRIPPDGVARILLSDINAAYEFDLAEEALDLLDIELSDDEDEYDEYEPVGDLAFAADFGLEADAVEVLCVNGDLFPDEQVTSMAKRLGFAEYLSTVMSSSRR